MKAVRVGLPAETWKLIYELLGAEMGRLQSKLDWPLNAKTEPMRACRNAQDKIEDALRDDAGEAQ